MEVTLYLDIWPGVPQQFLAAYEKPAKKSDGATRYRLKFTLPDPNKPDADGNIESVQELPASEQHDEHDSAETGGPETR